jgi:predicted double-glycine peptidase
VKRIWFILSFTVLVLCACSTTQVQRGANTVAIGDVPFFPQEDYQCGPASLAGVVHFWGCTADVREIAGEIFSKSARGTLTMDMSLYAERKGFTALQYPGDLDDLKSKIRTGYPLIVLVDYGFLAYHKEHFMVVIGYDADGLIVNSGKSEKLYVSNEDFLKTWRRTNNWTLWIKSK